MELSKTCEHGQFGAHSYPSHDSADDENPWFKRLRGSPFERWCPGGMEPTTEELVEEVNRRRASSAPYDIEIPDFVNRNSMGW